MIIMNTISLLISSSLLVLLGGCSFAPAPTEAPLPASLEALVSRGQVTKQDEQLEIFLRAFKQEQVLEIWGRLAQQDFRRLAVYPFCTTSGGLGSKRQEGDGQIPEGCYFIDRFNPNSRFYLSLGINYPNASDLKRGHLQRPGSDIFIHGGCASVGCISITDTYIEPVYELASRAQRLGQLQIPVHIFPSKNWKVLLQRSSPHLKFWKELQAIYSYFEQKKQLPKVRINARGEYYLP